MKYNNTDDFNTLITKEYSQIQIESLVKLIETNGLSFNKFKRQFDIQCIRQTHQGCYVVLAVEDERNAYVFINDDEQLTSVIIVDEFNTKEEFNLKLSEVKRMSELLQYDSNSIFAPASSVDITAHLVQEGIYLVKYSRIIDETMSDDPIVSEVIFVENENIATNEDAFVRDGIPFILEIDKSN